MSTLVFDATREGDFRFWDDETPTLMTSQRSAIAQPVVMRNREGKHGGGKGPLLSDKSYTLAVGNDQTIFQPVNFDPYNLTGGTKTHQTLTTNEASTGVMDLAVRRLTPVECERLMGWPDDHTRWDEDGREVAQTQRYKMCGNGVVAPVAEWVAHHLRTAMQYVTTEVSRA